MNVEQIDFATALLDPEKATPEGLLDPQGRPAGRRFSVYRNNVAVSLSDALETAFPVVRKSVGDEFFRAMAAVYLRAHPPSSPLLMFYGEEMPRFLAEFEPVRHLGYLPDIARLELAMRYSYHAADGEPIAPDQLASIPAERLMTTRFAFAPAVRLIRSDWPIHAVWAHNMAGAPAPQMRAESVLITRPEFDPQLAPLNDDEALCLEALQAGASLGEAIDAAGEALDLTRLLGLLIGGRAITALK